MVQLQHFNRSIPPFYMLLSDTREGIEAEVMGGVGDVTLGMAAGEAPARASCGPCPGDPFVDDYRINLWMTATRITISMRSRKTWFAWMIQK